MRMKRGRENGRGGAAAEVRQDNELKEKEKSLNARHTAGETFGLNIEAQTMSARLSEATQDSFSTFHDFTISVIGVTVTITLVGNTRREESMDIYRFHATFL